MLGRGGVVADYATIAAKDVGRAVGKDTTAWLRVEEEGPLSCLIRGLRHHKIVVGTSLSRDNVIVSYYNKIIMVWY
jgi:hypothetical protein